MNRDERDIESLVAIRKLKAGHKQVLKNEKWLLYLFLTHEEHINLERVRAINHINPIYLVKYVEKSLKVLRRLAYQLDDEQLFIVENVLKWSEVAKGGLKHHRAEWLDKGYNLYVHNIGSAQIFDATEKNQLHKEIIYKLIQTHGLVGQYIRGEVTLGMQSAVYELVQTEEITEESLSLVLTVLNQCIIEAVHTTIWENVKDEVEKVINQLVTGFYRSEYDIKTRIQKLRQISITNGEDFEKVYKNHVIEEDLEYELRLLLASADLWFVEAALHEFTFEEFLKIMMLIYETIDLDEIHHISFEAFMKDMYYDYQGKKKINIYKKRIIEKYLGQMTFDDIIDGKFKEIIHVKHGVHYFETALDTAFLTFDFSDAAERLIAFCEVAESSDILYEKAVVLLFDLFDLRRDVYDRFHNEDHYLTTMNQSIDYKKVILDYIVGNIVVDIGPGGGALMDLIEAKRPELQVTGVDISTNVIQALEKKKQLENRKWSVQSGDALDLVKVFNKGSVDTVIFSSIIHELYSYIAFEGQKFNEKTIASALKSAYEVLSIGGRMIIRDGIMTEPKDQKRIIRFLSDEGMQFLKMYTEDFKGRNITYRVIGMNEVELLVNDAMEFLYTYTWGEASYPHEVNEQFGYFTPSEYEGFIKKTLGEGTEIVVLKHYLQEGYVTALSNKVSLYDEMGKPTPLPDSTCLIVIEKKFCKY